MEMQAGKGIEAGSSRFTEQEKENMINRFGRSFYEKAMSDIERYAEQWQLDDIRLIPSFSANLVFTCFAEGYGDAVLKICHSSFGEGMTECETLLLYNGGRFCRVWETDKENGVFLEQRIRPGNPLRDEQTLETRLSVFCSLYRDLHLPALEQTELFPSYTDWVAKITDYMSRREDCPELYRHMKRAQDICLALVSAEYTDKKLLHGDFHHDNILLGADGKYTIIDPKGVIGDPVFDTPRFILNEYGDDLNEATYEKIVGIIGYLERELGIPNDVLRKCLYVETSMGECWCVQDGASPEELPKLLKIVEFAEAVMNGTRFAE